jgi:putative heme iron utilization protein
LTHLKLSLLALYTATWGKMWQQIYNRTEWTAMSSYTDRTPADRLDAARGAVLELIAAARKGALASLMAASGAPYASLVNVASHDGQPVMLLSRLAWHTENVLADRRACLLIAAEEDVSDPLTAPRVSLLGQIELSESDEVRTSYFNLHPGARSYAQFADFSFFTLNVETAHYVAGFGEIITLDRERLFGRGR